MKHLLTVSACFLLAISAIAQQQPKKGTLDWYVWDAHQRGATEVQLSEGIVQITGDPPLEKALSNNTVVIAQQLGEAVGYDGNSIVTFRKYRSTETITVQNSAINVPFPSVVPKTLLPLASDEFIVPVLGGTLVVDGITLNEYGVGHTPLRTPPSGKPQLMFLRFICKGYALLNYDERGLFWVDDNLTLHPLVPNTRLSLDIRASAGNNLQSLRSFNKELLTRPKQETSHNE